MDTDVYRTIKRPSEGSYAEKRSRFLAFATPVGTADEAMQHVREYRKKYYDARHVCWAYMTGADRSTFRVNDDGEPSSTAGKPILGQINSNELTDILIIVVRYYGGVELGTSRLTAAYRTAAALSIAAACIEERTVDITFSLTFDYARLDSIMKIIKEEQVAVISQSLNMSCEMTLRVRKNLYEQLKSRLNKVC
ncbi:MAG: YigZ family protein [Tannerella sp.]|nr:YigZ family protein [Tannerella sp.]